MCLYNMEPNKSYYYDVSCKFPFVFHLFECVSSTINYIDIRNTSAIIPKINNIFN